MKPFLFLYKSGRRGSPAAPTGPDEFFYGAAGLARAGHSVDCLDSEAIAALAGIAKPSEPAGLGWRIGRAPLAAALPGFPCAVTSHLFHPAMRERLSAAETIVATTTSYAYALATLKAAGQLKSRVIALAMGIFPDVQPAWQRAFFGRLLKRIDLVALSSVEADYLRARLPKHGRISDICFGVDTGFWTPGTEQTLAKRYVLAIGNDLQRDWTTLVSAWSPELPPLRIVTRFELPPLPENVEVIRGGWHGGGLSDEAVRDLYRNAALVVLPIKQTIQPSGQSAGLQAMACAAPIAISDYDGLWDRPSLRHAETCFLFRPGDPRALRECVRAAIADPDLRLRIGRAASTLVQKCFTSDHMSKQLGALLLPGSLPGAGANQAAKTARRWASNSSRAP
ncbi:MAG: glycosyltransferase family 4 protein [Azospirillum sp.]|nr:glycosyltransferase family 4 protein [Azospirillum sp.]